MNIGLKYEFILEEKGIFFSLRQRRKIKSYFLRKIVPSAMGSVVSAPPPPTKKMLNFNLSEFDVLVSSACPGDKSNRDSWTFLRNHKN